VRPAAVGYIRRVPGRNGLLDREDSVLDFSRVAEGQPASVTTTRTSEEDIGTRQLNVYLDGRRVATLLWGDSVTSELEPGPHTLRVSNTLVWKTVEFTLAPGEQVFFEAVNRMGPGSVLLTMFLGAGPLYVSLKRM
jgi:hypothetical protein